MLQPSIQHVPVLQANLSSFVSMVQEHTDFIRDALQELAISKTQNDQVLGQFRSVVQYVNSMAVTTQCSTTS